MTPRDDGRRPLSRATGASAVGDGPVAPVGELEEVIRVALAKDPADRYRDANAMAEALALVRFR